MTTLGFFVYGIAMLLVGCGLVAGLLLAPKVFALPVLLIMMLNTTGR